MPDATPALENGSSPNGTISPYWSCIRFELGRERLAMHLLRAGGFEAYHPVIRVQRRTPAGRRVDGSSGLFGVYGFVLIQSRWYDARWCPGVCGLLLAADGRPAKVGDEVIAALRAREDEHGFITLTKRRPEWEFAPGDQLRITKGAFAGHVVFYEGMSSRQRIEVLLAMLGAQRRVSLARADVRLETLRPSTNPNP
jgi:transcriptional antiterminator RfaH